MAGAAKGLSAASVAAGSSREAISAVLRRQPGAIQSRMLRLGLKT